MACANKIKEFTINLLILLGILTCRLLFFIGMTSVCIGISAMISQSYLYFNRVKLSTSFQTFVSVGCLILFSFCSASCTSAGIRRRIKDHPFMLFAVPHIIYISIYFYAFVEMFFLYMRVHSLPLGITNDAMYILDDTTTTPSKEHGQGHVKSQHRQTIVARRHYDNYLESDDKDTVNRMIEQKNWDTAFFLLYFVYIIYVTCRLILKDLEKNIPDDPSGSAKQLAAFVMMTISQVIVLFVYMIFLGFASVSWLPFCDDPKQCILITETVAILVGICAGFLESSRPWPQKRQHNEAADPFGWYENLLRARFSLLLFLFAFVNWSFFEERKGPKISLAEPSFVIFTLIVTATVIHVAKLFAVIGIKQANKVVEAYRLFVPEDMAVNIAENNFDLENPPPANADARIYIERDGDHAEVRVASNPWAAIGECSTTDDSSNHSNNNELQQTHKHENKSGESSSTSKAIIIHNPVSHNIIFNDGEKNVANVTYIRAGEENSPEMEQGNIDANIDAAASMEKIIENNNVIVNDGEHNVGRTLRLKRSLTISNIQIEEQGEVTAIPGTSTVIIEGQIENENNNPPEISKVVLDNAESYPS